MLLTTVKMESFEDACQRLNWYGRRWGIEVYHRTVKSGCRIEDRRNYEADHCPRNPGKQVQAYRVNNFDLQQ